MHAPLHARPLDFVHPLQHLVARAGLARVAFVDHHAGPQLEPRDGRLDLVDTLLLRLVKLLLAQRRQLLVDREGRVGAGPDRDLTAFELGDTVDHLVEQVAVMGDDHHCAFVAAHQPLHCFLARDIEVIVRLVQQEQIGLPHQQPRQPDEFGLPAAERIEGAVEGLVAQTQVAECRADAVLVGQPTRDLVFVQQSGVLFHHPRQACRGTVDGWVAHLRLGFCQRGAQPGDLGRAGEGKLQDGAGWPCVICVRAASCGRYPIVKSLIR